jgi:hypothetical protein
MAKVSGQEFLRMVVSGWWNGTPDQILRAIRRILWVTRSDHFICGKPALRHLWVFAGYFLFLYLYLRVLWVFLRVTWLDFDAKKYGWLWRIAWLRGLGAVF